MTTETPRSAAASAPGAAAAPATGAAAGAPATGAAAAAPATGAAAGAPGSSGVAGAVVRATGAAGPDAARAAYDELLDDLVGETASLCRLLAGRSDEAWHTPTPAAGWDVGDQVGHLAYFDQTALAALVEPDRFVAEAAGLAGRGDDFADAVAAEHRHLTPTERLEWLDRVRRQLVRAYRSADPRARTPWYGPPMSVMSAATARLMETWAHGVDVVDALGEPIEDTPRLRHVAHLGVRTMGFSFAHHGLDVPTAPVRVELASGTHRWTWGPADAADRVTGSALDFCLVVAQRRHPDTTALAVTGPVARAWMAVAQVFAGPPTLPRPPAPTSPPSGPGPMRSGSARSPAAGPADPGPAGGGATAGPGGDGAPGVSAGDGGAPGLASGGGDAAVGADEVAANLIRRVNVGDLLTRSARRSPGAEALVDGPRRWTYGELDAWVNRVANGLLARGYGRGDRLALVAANCAEFLVVYFACAKVGVICVPVNLGWRPDEVTYVLGHARVRGVVAEEERLAGLTAALEATPGVTHVVTIPAPGSGGTGTAGTVAGREVERLEQLAGASAAGAEAPAVVVDDRDPVSILYTSGTTSAPKGVVASHTAVYVETLSMALECRFEASDRFVAMLPMFHTAQLNVHCTPAVAVGAAIHVLRPFEPAALLAMIERERITQIFGLPMMYRAMLDHPDIAGTDLGSLRRAAYAMAPMPDEDLRRAIATFGCDFYLLFGQTEMSPSTCIFRPEHQLSHAGAVGTPVVNVEVAIMDADGRLLPQGEQGEVVYRGPHAMTGYLDDPAATAAAFAHGWFHSGDAGAFDGDGILWFRDRFKDVIKTGGENVASLEVEKAILGHVPGVVEAAVVGIHHEHWSEAITAFVVVAPGATVDLATVRAALEGRLDGYKIPKAVVEVGELPRTSTGKVRKTELRSTHDRLYLEGGR